MRVDFRHRWKLTREYLRAMKEIWTREAPSFNGEFISFPAIRTYPKPVQQPHPPIFIGAGGIGAQDCEQALADHGRTRRRLDARGTWRSAMARRAGGKLKELCAEAGRDFNSIEISALISPTQDADAQSVIDSYARGRSASADLPGPAVGAGPHGALPGAGPLQVPGMRRSMMFSLDGKAALIAGGTKGVGLEIAKTLARMGATLALNYAHNDAAAAAALDQVKAIAPKSVLLKADLEDEEQTRRMVRQAASDLGGLDIFIMNAVSTTTKSLLTVKPRSFWRTMAMNVGGFLVSAQELSGLISDNGRIVLISGNTTMRFPTPTTEVLGVAKAAMEGIVRMLAFELGPRGITVNGLGLGLYETESSRYALGLDDSFDARVKVSLRTLRAQADGQTLRRGRRRRLPMLARGRLCDRPDAHGRRRHQHRVPAGDVGLPSRLRDTGWRRSARGDEGGLRRARAAAL